MKKQQALVLLLVAVTLMLCLSVYAQVSRPYRNGSVWTLAFIRIKPGMESAYLNYVAGDWKKEQEAMKQAGYALSYKVLATEGHTPGDWNLLLMTEYKDMASMEANEQKAEAMLQKMFGGDEKAQQGYRERAEIREIIGDRLAREIVLEPRK